MCTCNRNWGSPLVSATQGLLKELMSLLKRRILMGSGLMACHVLNTPSLISLKSQAVLVQLTGMKSFSWEY
jgi:hypothetical protein